MKIKTGCDIVHVTKFTRAVERGGKSFLEKIFSPSELFNVSSSQSLAGIFAVKESVIKALELPAGSWLLVEIIKLPSGKPRLSLFTMPQTILSHDISISHDGEYALATSCFLLKE